MIRMRTMSALTVTAMLGLSLAVTGCGKYSWGALTAQKTYKDANALYQGSDWKGAAAKYEQALASDPSRTEIYFYLGNSYDNMFKASHMGEAENDALHPEGHRQLREGGRKGSRSRTCASWRSSISSPPTARRS